MFVYLNQFFIKNAINTGEVTQNKHKENILNYKIDNTIRKKYKHNHIGKLDAST